MSVIDSIKRYDQAVDRFLANEQGSVDLVQEVAQEILQADFHPLYYEFDLVFQTTQDLVKKISLFLIKGW